MKRRGQELISLEIWVPYGSAAALNSQGRAEI